MKTILLLLVLSSFTFAVQAQFTLPQPAGTAKKDAFSQRELSINGFRNPSIGVEYRVRRFSLHAGYYPTILRDGARTESGADNNTTSFLRAGVSYWFLPVYQRPGESPSAFYTSLSYLRGLDYAYWGKNALMGELGFRWMVWKGLNVRLGVAAMKAAGKGWQVNPTPGISYSFSLK
jgi:hypothetical protein